MVHHIKWFVFFIKFFLPDIHRPPSFSSAYFLVFPILFCHYHSFLSCIFLQLTLKITVLPLCLFKNRAKTGHFSFQFLPSNHKILWFNMPIFLFSHNTASELPSQRYFRCPNKVPVSPCLQNTPENGTLCASGICHLAAPARKCPPVPQSC